MSKKYHRQSEKTKWIKRECLQLREQRSRALRSTFSLRALVTREPNQQFSAAQQTGVEEKVQSRG